MDPSVNAAPRKGRKRSRLRLLVRCGALVTGVILALDVFPWPWTPLVLPSLRDELQRRLGPMVSAGSRWEVFPIGVPAGETHPESDSSTNSFQTMPSSR